MTNSNEERTTLVLTDVWSLEDGSMRRSIHLTTSGELIISGHDLGPGVERIFGMSEYEFERRLTASETHEVRRLLGVGPGQDLLAAIKDRFEASSDVEGFLRENNIEGQFWNRIGD